MNAKAWFCEHSNYFRNLYVMLSQIICCLIYSKCSCYSRSKTFSTSLNCGNVMCATAIYVQFLSCIYFYFYVLSVSLMHCVARFVRTTYMQFLLLSDLKAGLLTENVYQHHSHSPMVKNPSKSVICSACSRTCSHALFSYSVIFLNLSVGLKGSVFCAAVL